MILGVTTNTGFVRALLGDPDVVAGRLDTGLVERVAPSLTSGDVPGDVFVAAAMAGLLDREEERVSDDPFDTLADWRLGGLAWVDHRWVAGEHEPVTTSVRGAAAGAEVVLAGGAALAASATKDGDDLVLSVGGRESRWAYASAAGVRWLGREGTTWSLREAPAHVARAAAVTSGAGPLLAPMPGTLTVRHVAVGDEVVEGQPVVSVEAMKMEHVVRASGPGVVESLPVPVGRQVALDDVVAVLAPPDVPTP